MSRPNPTVLFGFFVAVIVALCGASLLKGGFYIGKHEGDTFHLLQIVFRMAEGQWPHLDFMTPIGVLAFAPIALFVSLGYGVGTSIFLAQTVVSLLVLPAVWWLAYSRLRGALPYAFGLIIFVLIGSLVHGEAQRSVSISMHYNRWAWAVAFIAITAAVIPAKAPVRPRIDGTIIGIAMVVLLLIKVTYVASFAIPILVALLSHRAFGTLLNAMVSGIVAIAVVTLVAGLDFWQSYLGDLLSVALSDVRPNPGEPFGAVVGAPAYLGASLTLFLSVIFLRQARQFTGGLLLLLLAPGFFYVTYQNFANDPQWLLLLGVLLVALVPAGEIRNGLGWDMRTALKMSAAVAFAMAMPSFLNLAYSPFRHYFVDTSDYSQMLPKSVAHADIYTVNLRTARTNANVPLAGGGIGLSAYDEMAGRDDPTIFKGETLPDCELSLGLSAWFDVIVADLAEAGLAQNKSIFAADLFSSHWLFGGPVPLEGGSPWYYGGLPGIENADYLLVPLCPVTPKLRQQILTLVDEAGLEFTEIRRTPLYILYAPIRG